MRSNSPPLPPGEETDPTISKPGPEGAYAQARYEAKAKSDRGLISEAITRMEVFKRDNPGDHTDEADREIALLANKYSLDKDRPQLFDRRAQLGLKFMTTSTDSEVDNRDAFALAYLKAATNLTSGSKTFVSQQLESLEPRVTKAIEARRPAQISQSEKLVKAADELSKKARAPLADLAKAEQKYIDAVSIVPEKGANWLKLGDFYRNQNRTDDARVMYSQALDYADSQSEANARLSSL